MVKIVSWNVNGLRTRIVDNLDSSKFTEKNSIQSNSNLGELITEFDPDIICFSETRCSEDTMKKFKIKHYYQYSNSSKGLKSRSGDRYSGVAIWTKIKPIECILDLPTQSQPDIEGRIITLYFKNFILINTYVPNAGTNFDYRITQWDPAIAEYLTILQSSDLPIIWTGDLNVARSPKDVFFGDVTHYHKNHKNKTQEQLNAIKIKYHKTPIIQGIGPKALAGFTKEERDGFQDILDLGFTDIWRHLNPNLEFNGYTWWNMRIPKYRNDNKGWRIDYFIINTKYIDLIKSCYVAKHIGETTKKNTEINKLGSDHAPICLDINL